MSKNYIISVEGKEVGFFPEEIESLESGIPARIWPVYHEVCKRHYNNILNFFPSELKNNGIEHFKNVITQNTIDQLLEEWKKFTPIRMARDENIAKIIEDETEESYTLTSYQITESSRTLISQIIRQTLSPTITQALENYFESYFEIDHLILSEAFPDKAPITSFRWHRDAGPTYQTHIMLYLDDAEETGGRTEFLSYTDTEKVINAGYAPDHANNRVVDIDSIVSNIKIIRPTPKKGDALIFNATRIYHKGIHPSQRSRKIIFFILKASPIPWEKAIRKTHIFGFPAGRYLGAEDPFLNHILEVEEDK